LLAWWLASHDHHHALGFITSDPPVRWTASRFWDVIMGFITRHPFRTASVVLVAVLVGVGYWFWHGIHSSTPADSAAAVSEFRVSATSEAASRPGVPAPGVYRFRQSGEEKAGVGPLSVSRSLPDEAVYIVWPTAGGYQEDLRMSKEHVEEVRFSVDGTGSHAVWRRTKVTFAGIGEDDRDAVTPPSLDHPSDLSVGRTWSGRYRLGRMTVDFEASVIGKETAAIDLTSLPVFVIRTRSEFEGPISGTRTDTFSWAPSVSLPVRWSIQQSTTGEAEFAMDANLELESAVPET
jgi:hypothetical protein